MQWECDIFLAFTVCHTIIAIEYFLIILKSEFNRTMKLIVINGPCGIGKSTVSAHLHDAMPLSYLLDVDAVTRNISHYREYKEERWELREAVAFSTVDAVLSVGRDILVEKMIFSEMVLDRYLEIGGKYNADVTEIILWASKEDVMKRAEDRGWREGSLLTKETCERFWNEMHELKSKRNKAHVIDVTGLDEKQVLEAVQKLLLR